MDHVFGWETVWKETVQDRFKSENNNESSDSKN